MGASRRLAALLLALAALACAAIPARSVAAQLSDDDREGIVEALASVYLDRDSFGLGDADFEALDVGESLPAYEALPAGPKRAGLDYFPLFCDGELVAFALRVEGGAFQLDTVLARGVGSLGPDRAALVFDRGACRVWDGTSLATAFEAVETVDGRADLSEGVIPSYFLAVETVELGPAESLGFSLARDLTARPSGGAGESASLVSDDSAVPPAAAGVAVLACLAAVALVIRSRARR
ncbi:hypothetical protein H6A23_04545 [Olsenella uli]|uniref:hypothetical protein n=1 Tax=Olsenella uli TaxID=133926 RepID=UPI00195B605E|nr:hypothetical protein [Olsenella uli]MBM6816436.1 hypothetical protein [Olsenella uli]